jgi:hypothetical protein
MTAARPTNLAASIRARLLNIARSQAEESRVLGGFLKTA